MGASIGSDSFWRNGRVDVEFDLAIGVSAKFPVEESWILLEKVNEIVLLGRG